MPAAPAERPPPAPSVGAPPAPAAREPRPQAPAPARAVRGEGLWWTTLLVAVIFCLITFYAKGGLNLASMTSTEIALTLGAGALIAASVLVAAPGARAYGLWPTGLLLAFTALGALSIVWSVQPDHSWQDSGRMLAYSGVFGAGVALVRVAPGRWPAILGGLTLAAVVVSGYALLTKVFPGLAPSDIFARLNEPYGYWNAVGLTAAMGAICCLWLGARRTGHALARALAYPAMALLLLTLALAYSRGALAALAIGVALWFCVVPTRLRGAVLLIVGGLGAAVVVAWDFSTSALSSEGVALAARATAGHQLGAVIAAMLLALTIVGIAIGFFTGRRAPSPRARRRAGAAMLATIVLALVAFTGALAHSQRGLTGTISHSFNALTDPNARTPPNTPGRLTAVASVRARYWKEALQVFKAHRLFGAGAEGYWTAHQRYETGTLEVRHAHGFIVQTLADLGLIGLLLALALLLVWIAAAGRATRPFNRRIHYTPERVGLLSMLCLVVVFGAHSLIDWTWYVPGNACVALLCAGWLAGRGPLSVAPGARSPSGAPTRAGVERRWWHGGPAGRPSSTRALVAACVIVAALLAAWSQWQPQRSEAARQQADARLEAHDPRGASEAADSAVARDPLSVEALFTLSSVQQVVGQPGLARATLERAVRLQPSNPQTWLALGRHDLISDPRAAVKELQAAIYLNPASISPEAIANGEREAIEIQNQYIQALRASTQQASAFKSASGAPARAAAGGRRALRQHHARRSG